MKDKSIAGLVAIAVVAPLCAICILGPAFFAAAAASVLGWFGGIDPLLKTGSAIVAGILVYRLVRWRKARTNGGEGPATRRSRLLERRSQ